MKNIDKKLDKKACEILASRLNRSRMFENKTVEEIASEIPNYRLLSQVMGEKGIVSRNFGSLSVTVYDLNTCEKDYRSNLKKLRAFHLTRGLPIAKNFLYALLEHGIKENIGYTVIGYKIRKKGLKGK